VQHLLGGVEFELGPNDRKSATGKLPRCKRCRSLERHRQLRQVYAQLPDSYIGGLDVLQLSPDIGVDLAWFNSYEVSVFEGENPLDLEAIDRADANYDSALASYPRSEEWNLKIFSNRDEALDWLLSEKNLII